MNAFAFLTLYEQAEEAVEKAANPNAAIADRLRAARKALGFIRAAKGDQTPTGYPTVRQWQALETKAQRLLDNLTLEIEALTQLVQAEHGDLFAQANYR